MCSEVSQVGAADDTGQEVTRSENAPLFQQDTGVSLDLGLQRHDNQDSVILPGTNR